MFSKSLTTPWAFGRVLPLTSAASVGLKSEQDAAENNIAAQDSTMICFIGMELERKVLLFHAEIQRIGKSVTFSGFPFRHTQFFKNPNGSTVLTGRTTYDQF